MQPHPSLSLGAAVWLAITSTITAEPIPQYHKRIIVEENPVLPKRQAQPSCTDALCVFSEALESISSASLASVAATHTGASATDTGTASASATESSAQESVSQQANIRVSVVQPSLCSASALQYSSAWSVPTGVIDIQSETGWGDQGSIWNISANDGVKLTNFRVPCQGSACTGITGNTESDGKITQNADGSWSMNVTANMQPSVGLFGQGSGGTLVNGKYDLTITSTPPCALPVFQNCSNRNFDPTADQWDAYSTGPFLEKYLKDNNINSLSALLAKASTDFLPTTDAQALICNPDAGTNFECDYPSQSLCDSSTPDATAGFLVVAAVSRMAQLLNLLYSTINNAQGDMAGYITQIVVKFFQPQATQKWTAIVTAVSSVIGLLTFIAIIIDALTEGAATGILVAAIVGTQSALAAAANFKNGFEAQTPDDTYLAIDGNYTQSVIDYARGLEEVVDNIWSNTELTQSGITAALASGAWLDVPNPFNVTGLAENARDWLDNLLVTSYINRVFNDADAFITFLPYQKWVYNGVYGRTELYDFTQADCAAHWNNDPGWPYYSTCDVPLGDTPGMAVVTRPSSEGKGSKTWTSGVEWNWATYKWDSHDMVSSAVTGFAEHGFGYNLTNIDFSKVLQGGSQQAIDTWKTLPLSTPGLFNIPVCVLSNMMDVPGGGQIAKDIDKDAVFSKDPFSCATSNSTATGAKFCDNVSDAIKKAVGCPTS
ncbi:MAG: hypothetical protein Q9220_005254 [cf. Caloplaca sp. 1 TL-2023]